MAYTVEVFSPEDMSPDTERAFRALVRKSGEVSLTTLTGLVSTAFAVGYVRVDERLIAVGGLKRPNADYRAKVFRKAKVADPGRYPYELGWLFVEDGHRGKGLASELTFALTDRLGDAKAYATSLTTNSRMHNTLKKAGFKRVGEQYESSRAGLELALFVRGE